MNVTLNNCKKVEKPSEKRAIKNRKCFKKNNLSKMSDCCTQFSYIVSWSTKKPRIQFIIILNHLLEGGREREGDRKTELER